MYKNNNYFAVYLNGELFSKLSTSVNFNPFISENLIIGQSYPNNDHYFKGTIYNFMVYKKPLTDSEVLENYKVNKTRYNLP